MSTLLLWFVPAVNLLTTGAYLRRMLRGSERAAPTTYANQTLAVVGWLIFGSLTVAFYSTTVWAWFVPGALAVAGMIAMSIRWDSITHTHGSTRGERWSLAMTAVVVSALLTLRLL